MAGRLEVWFLLVGLKAPCCLTSASEGRETWAAGSLRGFGCWVGFWFKAWPGGRSLRETTTVTFQNIQRALNSFKRAGTPYEADRRVFGFCEADVFGTRQESNCPD